jgi:protease I
MDLEGKRIALLATNGFEDDELTKPLAAVEDAGAEVTLISEDAGEIKGKHGTVITADIKVDTADPSLFDGLLLPGGVENPDKLRMNHSAIGFIKSFFESNKPVAAICHAPWLLIEANVIEGRTVTSWPSLKTDLENAGAMWVDEEVVVDQGLVTSRNPDDIPVFSQKAIEEFAEAGNDA